MINSFNKFLRTYEKYGINSNKDLDFLRSDKSEKFIKFNVNRQQELESLKINIFKCIQPKPKHNENASNYSIESNDSSEQGKSNVSDDSNESKEPSETNETNNSNQPDDSDISIEIQNDSIVIHLNSMKNIKYISNTE